MPTPKVIKQDNKLSPKHFKISVCLYETIFREDTEVSKLTYHTKHTRWWQY